MENRADESPAPGFGAETFSAASAWLENRARAPFFLFVHTDQVHDPYVPPDSHAHFFPTRPDSGEHVRNRDAYDREIRYTDELLGGLLDALERAGRADDTIVVVTSDHGEAFGEHGLAGHGLDLHDEALLVPLVLRAPGRIAPGGELDGQSGLVDLVPTLLELLGAPVPDDLHGRSLASSLSGNAPWVDRALVSTTVGGHVRSVRTSAWKYIEPKAGRPRFYDLANDPGERTNLATRSDLTDARAALA